MLKQTHQSDFIHYEIMNFCAREWINKLKTDWKRCGWSLKKEMKLRCWNRNGVFNHASKRRPRKLRRLEEGPIHERGKATFTEQCTLFQTNKKQKVNAKVSDLLKAWKLFRVENSQTVTFLD